MRKHSTFRVYSHKIRFALANGISILTTSICIHAILEQNRKKKKKSYPISNSALLPKKKTPRVLLPATSLLDAYNMRQIDSPARSRSRKFTKALVWSGNVAIAIPSTSATRTAATSPTDVATVVQLAQRHRDGRRGAALSSGESWTCCVCCGCGSERETEAKDLGHG